MIVTGENRVICIDYDTSSLEQTVEDATGLMQNASFFVMDMATLTPIIHPNLKNYSLANNTALNISNVEFMLNGTESTPESIAFEEQLTYFITNFTNGIPNYNSSYIPFFNFQLNNVTMILTGFPINISVSSNLADPPLVYLMCLTIPQSVFTAAYEDFKQIIQFNVYLQLIVISGIIIILFVLALYIVFCIAKSITTPIEDLVNLVKEIDLTTAMEEEDDAIHIKLDASNLRVYSKEINDLYRTFIKLKDVVKYAKEGYFSTNDAQALMNYSQALKIYEEIGNKRGQGIIHNNIGNLHLRNDRLDEAVMAYSKAEELGLAEVKEFGNHTMERKNSIDTSKKRVGPKTRRKTFAAITDSYLANHKVQLDEQYCNRLYQLVRCMLLQSQKTNKVNWEIIQEKLEYLVSFLDRSEGLMSRRILCMIHIGNCLIKRSRYADAEKQLFSAELAIAKYETNTTQYTISDTEQDEEHHEIPIAVLRQHILYHRGMLLKYTGKYKAAAICFTDAIEQGKQYDPTIRKACLLEIRDILVSQDLLGKAPNIAKILSLFNARNKDIVFVLDYSQSMGDGGRIAHAVSNILKVFDKYVKPKDRVAFIRFNLNCDIVFSLVEKRKNTVQLRKQIDDSKAPAGSTALLNALYEGIKLFERCELTSNSKWIVALTDGDDNESRITYDQVYKRLQRSDVNLVIVGLGLHQAVIQKLTMLCRVSQNGMFIESPEAQDLDVAFQAMSDIIYGHDLISENISF
jgi:tetratricopeptide (TPR) repeat protein